MYVTVEVSVGCILMLGKMAGSVWDNGVCKGGSVWNNGVCKSGFSKDGYLYIIFSFVYTGV
jgi:hypothetical protein